MKSKSADITCDQTLAEADEVMKVSEFLGKSRIKKYFYVLSRISDERKLRTISSLIVEESLCVCDIAYILGCSIAAAPHYLRVLCDVDTLDRQKEGRVVYYFIEDDDLKKMFTQLGR